MGRGEDRGFAQVRTREEVKRFALGVYAKWVTFAIR